MIHQIGRLCYLINYLKGLKMGTGQPYLTLIISTNQKLRIHHFEHKYEKVNSKLNKDSSNVTSFRNVHKECDGIPKFLLYDNDYQCYTAVTSWINMNIQNTVLLSYLENPIS